MREKLIEVRKKKGYTQEQMAEKLNIARTTYTGYENGNVSPSLETALNIKKILNYKKDDIFLTSSVSQTNNRINEKKWKEMRRWKKNLRKYQRYVQNY
mgnify:FL=1